MSVKLRKDLDGVVYLAGGTYKAGDVVPDGVPVGGHLTADGKAHGQPVVPVKVEPGVEALTEAEQVRAVELGIPTDVHPERVRGAIEGYEQGQADLMAAVDAEAQATADAAGNTEV
jgi:hypothetical protein